MLLRSLQDRCRTYVRVHSSRILSTELRSNIRVAEMEARHEKNTTTDPSERRKSLPRKCYRDNDNHSGSSYHMYTFTYPPTPMVTDIHGVGDQREQATTITIPATTSVADAKGTVQRNVITNTRRNDS